MILKDVAFEDLQVVVKFMYHGIVNVSSDKLPGVLKVRDFMTYLFLFLCAFFFYIYISLPYIFPPVLCINHVVRPVHAKLTDLIPLLYIQVYSKLLYKMGQDFLTIQYLQMVGI